MTEVDKYSYDDIETKIMSILYSNIDKKFNQFNLFDKLIKEKYTELYNSNINPIIKARFLLIIRKLVSRFDDIIVNKENNVYSVVCLSDKDQLPNVKNFVQEQSVQSGQINQLPKGVYTLSGHISEPNLVNPSAPIDYIDLLDYIVENNLTEDMNYVDPFDGNTIYHDLVITSNIQKISNMIDSGKFNYFVKNKQNQIPIDLCKDPIISSLLLSGIIQKYLDDVKAFNEKIQILEKKVVKYESPEYPNELIIKTTIFQFIWIKIYNIFKKNKIEIFSIIISIIAYLYIWYLLN